MNPETAKSLAIEERVRHSPLDSLRQIPFTHSIKETLQWSGWVHGTISSHAQLVPSVSFRMHLGHRVGQRNRDPMRRLAGVLQPPNAAHIRHVPACIGQDRSRSLGREVGSSPCLDVHRVGFWRLNDVRPRVWVPSPGSDLQFCSEDVRTLPKETDIRCEQLICLPSFWPVSEPKLAPVYFHFVPAFRRRQHPTSPSDCSPRRVCSSVFARGHIKSIGFCWIRTASERRQ